MKKVISLCFTIILWNTVFGYGQSLKEEPSFSVYVFEKRYNDSGKDYIKCDDIFKNIDLLSGYMIDPQKKDVFDLESVEKYLLRIYPHKQDKGVLCINIENKLYHNLRVYVKNSPPFKEAEEEFGKMVNLIRELRPNVKIGIYGIPFRTYYPSQNKWNSDNKLDGVLSMTDFIFPSLYILYPDKEKGVKSNDNYFRQNLDTAFGYGERLKKPVIPFVWYMVHINNKLFGGELLGKNEMKRYLQYIQNYNFENNKVQGIVWWETPTPYKNKKIKEPSHLENERISLENDIILQEYIQHAF